MWALADWAGLGREEVPANLRVSLRLVGLAAAARDCHWEGVSLQEAKGVPGEDQGSMGLPVSRRVVGWPGAGPALGLHQEMVGPTKLG